MAHFTTKCPWQPSKALKRGATSLGSVIAAWCFSPGCGNAPLRSAVGSRSALPVATAYRKTCPAMVLIRCADSRAPRLSTRRKTDSNSGALISEIGRLPIKGNRSRSNRLIIVTACPGVHVGVNFICHSRAMTSNVSVSSVFACFCDLRTAPGSIEVFYNCVRRHSALNYCSPAEFEQKACV